MNLLREYIQRTLASESVTFSKRFSINGIPISLEIADTPKKIQTGLMFRDKLNDNHGMIFIFPDSRQRSFWMRNTKIPLSIAYADSDGKIINIEDMTPYSEKRVLSKGPAFCALEMPQGWFRANRVVPGDIIVGVK